MKAGDVNILIADDEANILMLLEMELQAEGYRTTCCEDGGKALAAIREAQPVALLDWNMPVVSGLMSADDFETPAINCRDHDHGPR